MKRFNEFIKENLNRISSGSGGFERNDSEISEIRYEFKELIKTLIKDTIEANLEIKDPEEIFTISDQLHIQLRAKKEKGKTKQPIKVIIDTGSKNINRLNHLCKKYFRSDDDLNTNAISVLKTKDDDYINIYIIDYGDYNDPTGTLQLVLRINDFSSLYDHLDLQHRLDNNIDLDTPPKQTSPHILTKISKIVSAFTLQTCNIINELKKE